MVDIRNRPEDPGGVERDGCQCKSLPINDGHGEEPQKLAVTLCERETVLYEYSSVVRHHQCTVEKIKEQHVQQQNIAPVTICNNNLSLQASLLLF